MSNYKNTFWGKFANSIPLPDMDNKKIEFLRITHLKGPNLWTYRPTLEVWVDIGDLEDYPSNKIPGFYERLAAFLPSLIEHQCSPGVRGGFLQRVKEGTWPAHILEHVTIELQTLAGMQTGFGRARETSQRGVYKVAVRTREMEVSKACLFAARDLIMAAIQDRPFDLAATLAPLRELADSRCLGPSTANIVDAATDRGIPHIRLTDGNLVQLGYGARQRRIWTAETDRTSAIAESISRDKDLTKSLLSSCGVPVPEGREVDSAADAWDAAEDIGLPVVVKPTDGNHGRGVFTNLKTQEEVLSAYDAADQEGSGVIVERFVEGAEHRVLVVGGRVAAVTKGDTASVLGDGQSTILQLIDAQINSDPRRGEEEDFPLSPILLEREPIARLEIERQGFTPESVPPAGQEVLIIRHGNMAFDVTDDIHPDTAALAVLAAKIVGLDIAGIDMVVTDISKPLHSQRGAIVEVNAGPSLLMHIKPAVGTPRPVGRAIVDNLFAADDTGRIPVVGITGSQGTTQVAKHVAWMLRLSGRHTGLACAEGLFLDQRQVEAADARNHGAGERLLINRAVDAVVLENPVRQIVAEGLSYDRCHVGVVTDLPSAEGLGEFYIENAEQVYKLARTQVDVVLTSGVAVLNGADSAVADMATLSDGDVILYAQDEAMPSLLAHREQGKRTVSCRGQQVVLLHGAEEWACFDLAHAALAKRPDFVMADLLAAVATAWALGISPELMRVGIETFGLA